ncbi:MAG: bifunctional riboflavin kinase/FAD synthetase [Thermodesulfobacteriota bacterium]|nr:bifunctional riboflavin kinase/FAD synthetase [Thermodesulfobacteriota bacterium]
MKIINGSGELRKKLNNPVITIGNFDGIHLGHQKIFKEVKDRAFELKGDSIVYTFHPHPVNILVPQKKVPLITSFSEKMKLLEESGIDIVICEEFSAEYANLSPRQFIKNILLDKIGIRAIFVGYDYAFGKGREGNINTLRQLGKEFDFHVNTVDTVKLDGVTVSSTKIRDFIQKGEVGEVRRFLGRDYSISGKVGRGKSRGKGLGFPTANLKSIIEIIPKPGIYVTYVLYRGEQYQGVVNIGFNPTFKDKTLSVEAHIFDFNRDIYDEEIRLSFVDRLRDEKIFNGPDELVKQIDKDVKRAKEIFCSKKNETVLSSD